MGNQIDLAGVFIAAILAVPGQWLAAYQAHPEPWNLVGLMMAAVGLLSWAGSRVTGGRRRRAR